MGSVDEKAPDAPVDGPRGLHRRLLRRRTVGTPLVVVSACVASVQMSWSLVVPVLPVYARDFGLNAAQLGLVVAVFGVGRLLINIPAGLLSERMDRRWLLLVSAVAVVVGQVLTGFAVDYPTLIAARVATGLAGGVAITSGMALLADLTTPATRGRDMSTLQGFQLAGGALGPVFGGFLYTGFGTRATFLVSGATALLVVGWAYRVLRRVQTSASRHDDRSQPAARWLTRDVLGVCLLGFSVFFHRFGGLQALIPLIAYGLAGISVAQLGVLLGAVTVCNIVVVRFAGGLSDRIGRKRVIVPSMAVVALGCAGLAVADSSPAFVIATLVTGVAAGLSGPTPAAYLVDVTPATARGTVTGVYRTFGDLGGIIGPLLLGFLVDVSGEGWAALALAGVMVVMTAAFALLSRETTGPHRVLPNA
jgi:MFS family permease